MSLQYLLLLAVLHFTCVFGQTCLPCSNGCCRSTFPVCCSQYQSCCPSTFPNCCPNNRCCPQSHPHCCSGGCCSAAYPVCCTTHCCPSGTYCCGQRQCCSRRSTRENPLFVPAAERVGSMFHFAEPIAVIRTEAEAESGDARHKMVPPGVAVDIRGGAQTWSWHPLHAMSYSSNLWGTQHLIHR